MFFPLAHIGLGAPVGPDLDNEEGDVSSVGHALDTLGYPAGDAARTGQFSGRFADAVAAFQSDHGLTVDRVLLPGGETQHGLNRRLSTRAAQFAQTRDDGATAADADRPRPAPAPATPPAPPIWPGREPDRLWTSAASDGDRNVQATSIGWLRPDKAEAPRPLWFRNGLAPSPAPVPAPVPASQPSHEDAAPSLMDEYARLRRLGYDYRPDSFGRLGQGDWYDERGRKLGESEKAMVLGRFGSDADAPAARSTAYDDAPTEAAPPSSAAPTISKTGNKGGESYTPPGSRSDPSNPWVFVTDLWDWANREIPSMVSAKRNQIARTEKVIEGFERELERKDLTWLERMALVYARGQVLNTLLATEGQFPTTPLELGFAGLELAGMVKLATGSIKVFRRGNRIYTERDIVDGKLVGPGRALKENQNPYDPIAMRQLLEGMYPNEKVISYTVPEVSYALKHAGKRNEKTGIVHSNRALPIFDDIAVFDTRIPKEVFYLTNDTNHMRVATRALRESLERGELPRTAFTWKQLQQIESGKAKIHKFTWHHGDEPGRMQLVPTRPHQRTRHLGGMSLRDGR